MTEVESLIHDRWGIENFCLIEELADAFIQTHYGRGDLILKRGVFSGGYHFLLSPGLIRCIYCTPAGKEITECFIDQAGQPAMPTPEIQEGSEYEMQALTDVDILYLPKEKLQAIAGKYPELLLTHIRLLEAALNYQIELRIIRYTMNARERYLWVRKKYPDLFRCARLKDIASFLDISPVTLSRIRKEEARTFSKEGNL